MEVNSQEFMLSPEPGWFVVHFNYDAGFIRNNGIGVPYLWIKLL